MLAFEKRHKGFFVLCRRGCWSANICPVPGFHYDLNKNRPVSGFRIGEFGFQLVRSFNANRVGISTGTCNRRKIDIMTNSWS